MSRPDSLEPFTAHVTVDGGRAAEGPAPLVTRFLEDIARRCEEAGSTLIGHIKCHVETEGVGFHCNLTSRRGGARCAGPAPHILTAPPAASSGLRLEMDLAVLVYGLERETIDRAVREALADVFQADGGEWTLEASAGTHHH